MPDTVRFGLTGDVMLGRKVDERQRHRPPAAVWGDLRERLQRLDGLLVNLECCLSTGGQPWTRTYRPFHFRADPGWAIPALEDAGVDCCVLANNHLLDFGESALLDTVDHLDDADIAHTGAGADLDAALEPAVVTVGGVRIAVVSFTDNTPEYAADESSPGVAYVTIDVDDEQTRNLVSEALSRARAHDPDVLVTSLHWGPNMVTEPPAAFEAFGRWLVDRGVDLIHGHSAHVFQALEVYDGAVLCYDTGDFVDDYAVDPELRNDRSFLFETRLDATGTIEELRLLPTEISDGAVNQAGGQVSGWARNRMRARSAPYGTEFDREGEELVLSP